MKYFNTGNTRRYDMYLSTFNNQLSIIHVFYIQMNTVAHWLTLNVEASDRN